MLKEFHLVTGKISEIRLLYSLDKTRTYPQLDRKIYLRNTGIDHNIDYKHLNNYCLKWSQEISIRRDC